MRVYRKGAKAAKGRKGSQSWDDRVILKFRI